jgi:hypothetical protein
MREVQHRDVIETPDRSDRQADQVNVVEDIETCVMLSV